MNATARPASVRESTSATGRDLVRQIVVISSVVFMLVAAMVGVGLFGGTPVQDLQDGALDTDGSYLAPATRAFSIWSVIYLGLIVYAVWQALPSQRARARQQSMGWLISLTAVLNGLWLVTAQYATLLLTVIGIVILLIALAVTFRASVLTRVPGDGVPDALLIDGVTGLHLGWVSLATVANTAAYLTVVGDPSWADAADVWGVTVVIVVGVIALLMAWRSGWRVAPGLAIGWGLTWLGVERLAGEPASSAIGITALIVAGIVVVIPVAVAGLRLLRPEMD